MYASQCWITNTRVIGGLENANVHPTKKSTINLSGAFGFSEKAKTKKRLNSLCVLCLLHSPVITVQSGTSEE